MTSYPKTKKIIPLLMLILLLAVTSTLLPAHAASLNQSQTGTLTLLDRSGQSINSLTDGNLVSLKFELPQKAAQNMEIRFLLDTDQVAACTIPSGALDCTTDPFFSLGWYWSASGAALPQRLLAASAVGLENAALPLTVKPRPVVMVHGFASTWEAWTTYLGPDGYLAKVGIPGFAVGDGQVQGSLNTGSLDDPAGKTNTIQQNAEIVGQYITNVKKAVGAEMVDLVAHSMGGLISRYYIDQVMGDRDVAQLIMLGSPMAGTECANLPASLGLYLPATLEIRPSYVVGIFNQQITHRRGLAFYALAGDPITDAFKSPCTSVPTDIAVSLSSVTAIPLEASLMPVLHIELNTSQVVFSEFLLPLLQKSAGQYPDQPDQSANPAGQPLQFTRVYTGHIEPGQSQEIVIQIEAGVSVAGFSLFDTTRTLQNRVLGASGNEIQLSPDAHGLVVIKDPSTLFYLGYGFKDPKPGQWRVILSASNDTPAQGADYALTAYMIGGAQITASALPLLPLVDEPVSIEASFSLDSQPLEIQSALARIRQPDGEFIELELAVNTAQAAADWQPSQEGLYGIDILLTGLSPQGELLERTAFLSVQAQPIAPPTRITLFTLAVIVAGALLVLILLVIIFLIRRRR